MSKNTILVNLKNSALCVIVPLMMVACGQKNNNVDAELADVETKLAMVDKKLVSMQAQTDSLLVDSLSRNPKSVELAGKIAEHQQALNKLSAPKDTVKIKRFNKKVSALRMDSVMNANKVKEQVIANRIADFRVVYKEQDLLRARRDSLMKIKSRQR